MFHERSVVVAVVGDTKYKTIVCIRHALRFDSIPPVGSGNWLRHCLYIGLDHRHSAIYKDT